MSKISMREFKEARAKEKGMEIETDEETFVIPPPELWSDDIIAIAETKDNLALCKALIGGEETYARFVKAGGGQAMMGQLIEEMTGVKLPK